MIEFFDRMERIKLDNYREDNGRCRKVPEAKKKRKNEIKFEKVT